MAKKKPNHIDFLRVASCWVQLLLLVLAFVLPLSSFQFFALIAIIIIAILQFTTFRHY
jgi:hypothetical protein